MKKEVSKLKAAVLMGGVGRERQISLQSGSCVSKALKEAGLDVVAVDISPDKLDILDDTSIDVFFIALHGRFGEDGQMQQILEEKGLCYTGSGPASSELAFDKLASKKCFVKAGVMTPRVIEFDSQIDLEQLEEQLGQLSEKLVVKPIRQGSTIGVTIVDNPKSALVDAQKCINEFGDCMIEEFIAGREITVGVLDGRALPIVEIKTKSGFYDYQAKYLDKQTHYLFDTVESNLAANIQGDAVKCFNSLGLRDFVRVDFILGDDEKAYALEANTIPGMTSHSLLPKAAAKVGLSMSELCLKIIEAAVRNNKIADNV